MRGPRRTSAGLPLREMAATRPLATRFFLEGLGGIVDGGRVLSIGWVSVVVGKGVEDDDGGVCLVKPAPMTARACKAGTTAA